MKLVAHMAAGATALLAMAACTGVDQSVPGPGADVGEQPTATVAVSVPEASHVVEPERVAAAGESATIGFNNAAQVLTTSDGVQHYVFMDGGRTVMHGSASGTAAGIQTTAVRSGGGKVSLTAIAATDDVIVVGWTETEKGGGPAVYVAESADGGSTWGTARQLAPSGTALSLAGDGDSIVAAWHTGDETTSEIHFSMRDGDSGEWSEPVRVDGSSAGPLWPAVEVSGDSVWVTWRDNRSGPYQVYLRRSVDGGVTWLEEQVMARPNTGDPTVCAGDNGVVWLAYHGRGEVAVVRSTDGGATFGAPMVVGSGWFPRLSCDAAGAMVLGWEQSEGMDPKADIAKQAANATGSGSGEVGEAMVLSETAGTCASVTMRGDGFADAVWVDKAVSASGAPALQGELWHAVVAAP